MTKGKSCSEKYTRIARFIGERQIGDFEEKKRRIKIPFPLETSFNIMGMVVLHVVKSVKLNSSNTKIC